MKVKFVISIVFLICIIIICACTNANSEEDVIRLTQKYDKTISGNTYGYQKDLFAWLTPEEIYSISTDSDRTDNIVRIENNYIIRSDRLYFTLSRDHSSNLWAYVGLNTGEMLYLCPDPLCTHTKDSGCKYLNLKDLVFIPGSDHLFYAVKEIVTTEYQMYDAICFIDTENDIIHELYSLDSTSTDINGSYTIKLYFLNGSKLYFLNTKNKKEKNDSGELIRKTESIMMTLDIETKAVEKLPHKYSSGEYWDRMDCILASDKYLFFNDSYNGKFYATDFNFENEYIIMDYGNEFSVRNLYYDPNTQETFFTLCSKYMIGQLDSKEIEEGYVYCINNNLECRKIFMPSDKILNIQLTKNYIYYTSYDPVDYGVGRIGHCIDETGNKIYRVKREDTSASEIVFDGHGELLFRRSAYIIIGDYIYIDYYTLVQDEIMSYFMRMGSTVRVNFKDNTIKWLNLE